MAWKLSAERGKSLVLGRPRRPPRRLRMASRWLVSTSQGRVLSTRLAMSMCQCCNGSLKRNLVAISANDLNQVANARFDQDQPAEAPQAAPLSRTPAAKKFIACDPAYQAAVKAYAAAPAHEKAAHRIKMNAALQAALRAYHQQHPTSPAAEKTQQAELAAANEAYLTRPRQPLHIEYSEALNDGPAEASDGLEVCRDTR